MIVRLGLVRTRTVVVLCLLAVAAGALVVRDRTSDPSQPALGNKFALGANLPWIGYGHDLGATAWGHDGFSAPASRSALRSDFARLKADGSRVVRVFVFSDGRASPEFDGSRASGLDADFGRDLEELLDAAAEGDQRLILVLLDYLVAETARTVGGVQLGGRAGLITDPTATKSFLDNAVGPLLRMIRRSPHANRVQAIDILNEPEGLMAVDGGGWVADPLPADQVRSFVRQLSAYVRGNSSLDVTVGSATQASMLRYWSDMDLDILQFHYYDEAQPLPSYRSLGVKQPVIVGEFPSTGARSTASFLDEIAAQGYAGALIWSVRADDEASDYQRAGPAVAAWTKERARSRR